MIWGRPPDATQWYAVATVPWSSTTEPEHIDEPCITRTTASIASAAGSDAIASPNRIDHIADMLHGSTVNWLVALLLACSASVEVPPPTPEPAPVVEPEPEPEPLPDPTEAKLAATHLLVAYEGAAGASVERTKAEAEALATELLEQADPGSLPTLARKHSDDPTGRRGGRLGVWKTGRMAIEFERCVSAAEVGQLGPLCETPFGFHIVRRDPVEEASGEQLTLRYTDRDAAVASIEAIRNAISDGKSMSDAAAEHGATFILLEDVAPGQLVPDVEKALFGLDPQGVSEPIETPGAFHLVKRGPT